ncbi:protein TonB [Allochromatium warmingii]|uniref:Protein TonB n=1 Tax=Allochromatium warmingii TaxID=61595 RepID=A0A1H3HTE2_ALLWA|nr:energy transducer TonB [Allochromatium warmingii]SDY18495.1 protein TonB [Allochromatium warmingii]
MQALAPLPTLPLWLAMLIALGSEAALVAGLTQWLPLRRTPLPAAVPIEVSVVAVSVVSKLTDMASPDLKPVATAPVQSASPEPESKPEPPLPVRAPDPTPAPVALASPKPKSQAKLKSKSKSKPKPQVKAKPPKLKHISPPPRRASRPIPAKPTNRESANATPQVAANAPRTTGTPDGSPVAYLSNPAPDYPDAAQRLRLEGTVSLRVLVNANGQASQVLVANSSGVSSLDQAAVRTVRRWRFKPAHQNGRPISAWVRVPVRFKLNR